MRFVVFDLRFNLRRLPPLREDGQTDDLCYFVMHNGHAYAFQDFQFAAQRQRQSLSWYKAMIRVATGDLEPDEKGAGRYKRSELGVAAYNLFLETQEMQPDMDAIIVHIEEIWCQGIVWSNCTLSPKTP